MKKINDTTFLLLELLRIGIMETSLHEIFSNSYKENIFLHIEMMQTGSPDWFDMWISIGFHKRASKASRESVWWYPDTPSYVGKTICILELTMKR